MDCLKYGSSHYRKDGFCMALVIMNDNKYYLMHNETGALKKTQDIEQAEDFGTLEKAIEQCRHNPTKTRGYYIYDTVTNKICFKTNPNRKKVHRKIYSQDTRQLIYERAEGRCELCGRKILFEDMTLDHVKPLSMGGEDNVNNLSCTCEPCNFFKGNILPDTFFERISLIYLYQMEKKYRGKLKWKIIHKVLSKMI